MNKNESQIEREIKELTVIVKNLDVVATNLLEKINPILSGLIPSSDSSISSERILGLCDLAIKMYQINRDVQKVISKLPYSKSKN